MKQLEDSMYKLIAASTLETLITCSSYFDPENQPPQWSSDEMRHLLREAIRLIKEGLGEKAEEIHVLRRQRDELAEALQECMDHIRSVTGAMLGSDSEALVNKARQALSRLEKEGV